MKDTPPFLTDEEANTAYNAAWEWMLGTKDPKDFMAHASISTTSTIPLSPTKYETAPVPSPYPSRPSAVKDTRNPEHALHAKFQKLRHEITFALNNQIYIRDFSNYIPYTAPSPETFARLTSLLQMRDTVEQEMVNLINRVSPNGTPPARSLWAN
jgi:hypothetical protein